MKMLKVLIIVAAALGLLACAAGWLMAGYTLSNHPQSLKEAREWQEDHYDLSWYDLLAQEDYTVDSFDGYTLHVQLLRNPQPQGRYVIISHGYTDNRFGALKYAKLYLDRGFHVIVYDLRGHGLNEETFCTYSAREGQDLYGLIQDTRSRYGDIQVLGIHGESLGGASTVACLKYAPEIDFAVADCPFSDIATVLKDGAKAGHIPTVLVDLASLAAKLRFGYSYADMRPVDALQGNQIPLLLIHGGEDTFILPEHSLRIQQADPGPCERYVIPGAGHAESVLKDPEAYREYLTDFLESILQ